MNNTKRVGVVLWYDAINCEGVIISNDKRYAILDLIDTSVGDTVSFTTEEHVFLADNIKILNNLIQA